MESTRVEIGGEVFRCREETLRWRLGARWSVVAPFEVEDSGDEGWLESEVSTDRCWVERDGLRRRRL